MNKASYEVPPGYRFKPTDLELVLFFLWRKIYCAMLLPIFELDVFQYNPWNLPGDVEEKKHFFCKGYWNTVNKCDNNLNSSHGQWIPTDEQVEQIVDPRNNKLVGMKRSLKFHKNSSDGLTKTRWFMDQYCLVGTVIGPIPKNLIVQLGDWLVCSIYQAEDETITHDDMVELPTNIERKLSLSNEIVETSFSDSQTKEESLFLSNEMVETSLSDPQTKEESLFLSNEMVETSFSDPQTKEESLILSNEMVESSFSDPQIKEESSSSSNEMVATSFSDSWADEESSYSSDGIDEASSLNRDQEVQSRTFYRELAV